MCFFTSSKNLILTKQDSIAGARLWSLLQAGLLRERSSLCCVLPCELCSFWTSERTFKRAVWWRHSRSKSGNRKFNLYVRWSFAPGDWFFLNQSWSQERAGSWTINSKRVGSSKYHRSVQTIDFLRCKLYQSRITNGAWREVWVSFLVANKFQGL